MRIRLSELKRMIHSEMRLLREDKDDASAKDVSTKQLFPSELDKVDPALAKILVKSGPMDKDKSDDVVAVSPASWSASDLKPSQTTMRLDNTVGMALSMLAGKMDSNLGCIVSSDNHIMDGHHRWSAAILVDPQMQVSGYSAALPGDQLLGVLNVLTKGVFGKSKGNPGKGSIAGYTPEAVKAALESAVESGTKFLKPEQIKKLLEDKYGSVEEGIETMSSNVEAMSKEVPGWAPDRVQMPVIDPKEVPKAAKILNAGEVDVNPPHASVVKRAVSGAEKSEKSKKESIERQGGGSVVVERWQRLAGLIK